MSRIRGRDTKLEILVRRRLFRDGFRFRVNVRSLPGKPDIVLRKYRAAIFVNGCFWHHHRRCKLGVLPTTRSSFWKEKLLGNRVNDRRKIQMLKKSGWNTFVLWECRLERDLDWEMQTLARALRDLIST
ncbi:MAG: very short patch repair endonuclease [Acidobacteriia bacterium]|nr:very short patch repair endonuclease [Terriglobia bacterium]